MSSFFELTPRATAKAIMARKIVSVRCCGELMYQKNIYTSMPHGDRDFGMSLIVLACQECGHEIDLELSLNTFTAKKGWLYLDVMSPYKRRKYTKRKRSDGKKSRY